MKKREVGRKADRLDYDSLYYLRGFKDQEPCRVGIILCERCRMKSPHPSAECQFNA